MRKVYKGKIDLLSIITAFLLFFSMMPFFLWGVKGSMMLLLLVLPIVPLIFKNEISYYKEPFAAFLFILLFNVVVHGYNLLYSIYLLVFVFVPFAKVDFSNNVYDVFRRIIALCFAISLLQWVLFWLGIGIPRYYLEPLNELKEYNYIAFPPLLVVPNVLLDSVRFHACFDEPGVVGTISFLILMKEDYCIKDIYNIIILVSALCSLSFFFVLGSVIYFVIRNIRKPWMLLIMVFIIGVFYMATKDNPILDENVYARFEWDASKGKFAGDLRFTNDLDTYYDSIKWTHGYFFGIDDKILKDFIGSYGYKIAVMRYGMVFFALYILFFIFFAFKKHLSIYDLCFFIFVLIATLYQRPNLYDAVYVFLFTQIINSHARLSQRKRIFARLN